MVFNRTWKIKIPDGAKQIEIRDEHGIVNIFADGKRVSRVPVATSEELDEADAAKAVERLGGKLTRDDSLADRSVIGIELANTKNLSDHKLEILLKVVFR